jgi:molybdate transport system substrate-binding protein
MSHSLPLVLTLVLAAGAPAIALDPPPAIQRRIMVAAAASLSLVVPELTRRFHDATGIDAMVNYAGSNTLARQIVSGAGVDVFISADAAQMDVVDRAGLLVPGSRFDLLGNQLAVVASARGTVQWPDALGSPAVRRVAMGDPAAVPAGVYGRRWLESIGLWAEIHRKVVPLPTSPAALAAAREGRADAAIVYTTDTQSLPSDSPARVVYVVPADQSPEIFYPAAAIRRGKESDARRFLEFLRSREAAVVFAGAGFRHLPQPR